MATKTEINAILKELNLTYDEMDVLFEDLASTNKLVANFVRNDTHWSNLNAYVIKSIPEQKEKDLAQITENEALDELKRTNQKAQDDENDYYYKNFENIMLERIINNHDLLEDELEAVISDYEVESEDGDEGRWDKSMRSIIKLNNQYFALHWRRGLTENQEDMYDEQPYPVEKKERVITITDWVDSR